jgi:TPR repeat protein
MRRATWIAVLIGGAAGTAAALANKPADSLAPPALEPAAAMPAAMETQLVPPPPPASPEPPASASAAALNRPTLAAADYAPVPLTPTVGSRYELTGYEIACYEKKDPGACRAVATAYEEGKVVPGDLGRAKLFRKIELTFLVKHCESQVAAACSDLSYRYQRGVGVARSERNAQTLLARAKELCGGRKSDFCASLGP